jgi:hypothetical protein
MLLSCLTMLLSCCCPASPGCCPASPCCCPASPAEDELIIRLQCVIQQRVKGHPADVDVSNSNHNSVRIQVWQVPEPDRGHIIVITLTNQHHRCWLSRAPSAASSHPCFTYCCRLILLSIESTANHGHAMVMQRHQQRCQVMSTALPPGAHQLRDGFNVQTAPAVEIPESLADPADKRSLHHARQLQVSATQRDKSVVKV